MEETHNYILKDDGSVVPEPDVVKWGAWYENADRKLWRTEFGRTEDGNHILISTVFLGIDHGISSDAAPFLFETMIFGGEHNDYCERYTSKVSAGLGHMRAVEMVLDSLRTQLKEVFDEIESRS